MENVADVMLPRKEALAIMERVRSRLVAELKSGKSREAANAIVADWLRGEGNILSPYADYVVGELTVTQDEIDMRLKYGDETAEALMELTKMMKSKAA